MHAHSQMIALCASKPYAKAPLDDLAAHASNHSVPVLCLLCTYIVPQKQYFVMLCGVACGLHLLMLI